VSRAHALSFDFDDYDRSSDNKGLDYEVPFAVAGHDLLDWRACSDDAQLLRVTGQFPTP
jgi:hypothetical protein